MSASPESENDQNAMPAAPFNDTRVDCIVRSSDGVDFRIFKIILSLASPIFADTFNNPGLQSISEQNYDGPQVVTVSENSKVLDLCLRHLYPLPSTPILAKLQAASILADFAYKYEVQTLESMAVRHLTDAIEGDPVGVYALAVTRELITYHAACEDAASAVTSGREWFPSWEGRLTGIWTLKTRGMLNLLCMLCTTQDPVSRTLVEESGSTSRRFGPWCLWNHLHRSASVLAHHPTAAAVTTQHFVLEFCDCHRCPVGIREDMLAFSRIFAGEIENAVKQISLPEIG